MAKAKASAAATFGLQLNVHIYKCILIMNTFIFQDYRGVREGRDRQLSSSAIHTRTKCATAQLQYYLT